MWSAIREYIAAEVQLGILRYDLSCLTEAPDHSKIAALEQQSTRMETAIREML